MKECLRRGIDGHSDRHVTSQTQRPKDNKEAFWNLWSTGNHRRHGSTHKSQAFTAPDRNLHTSNSQTTKQREEEEDPCNKGSESHVSSRPAHNDVIRINKKATPPPAQHGRRERKSDGLAVRMFCESRDGPFVVTPSGCLLFHLGCVVTPRSPRGSWRVPQVFVAFILVFVCFDVSQQHCNGN
ncbi:hypothetical protein E2C01_059534 [Portunus trituberculatus]|uniref:Uncharacterized protein n=1 Tax=Portunus trituberculatus TaxID=210409 RepID=A0A5B7GZF5_PORTR|nr:hypothetical protein [Portunus trituberculatus]